MIKPKGFRLLVEEIVKENKDGVTRSGIILEAKDKDSHDGALLKGKVIEVGTVEIDSRGFERKPDIEKGTVVWFNRYECFVIFTEGLTKYWAVPCGSVFCVGEE